MSTTNAAILVEQKSNAFGILSFIFGIIGIFVIAIVFVPLSIIFGVIGLIKKQYVWSIAGLICAGIATAASPLIMGMLMVASAG
ncbi:hypothetical protein MNBD_GAMMA12-3985 [hydrothermal vent metagenome]|uniref:DUF4190 domain-containing protein n=1 Tax=hydrothermal vent metagenome TaxID=652676 RepID=A0A3B0Y4V0_9ZZZZ